MVDVDAGIGLFADESPQRSILLLGQLPGIRYFSHLLLIVTQFEHGNASFHIKSWQIIESGHFDSTYTKKWMHFCQSRE